MTFCLSSVVSHHSNELPAILGDSGLSCTDRTAHLNALKMNCYLLTGLVDAFEMETCKSGLLEVGPGGKVGEGTGGKGKQGDKSRKHVSLLISVVSIRCYNWVYLNTLPARAVH